MIMESIYQYIHQIMIRSVSFDKCIRRKDALYLTWKYLKIPKPLLKRFINEMVELELLKKINKNKFKVINEGKSRDIASGALLSILESGEYREKYQKGYQAKYRKMKKNLNSKSFVESQKDEKITKKAHVLDK